MRVQIDLLQPGSCEGLKAGVHATALGLSVVMGAYNAAAWLRRREPHLAVNAVLYAALTLWEQRQLAHHLARLSTPPREFESIALEEASTTTRVAA